MAVGLVTRRVWPLPVAPPTATTVQVVRPHLLQWQQQSGSDNNPAVGCQMVALVVGCQVRTPQMVTMDQIYRHGSGSELLLDKAHGSSSVTLWTKSTQTLVSTGPERVH